jgi:hypothetical protein
MERAAGCGPPGEALDENKVPVCREVLFLPGASGAAYWKFRKTRHHAGVRMKKGIAAAHERCTGMTGDDRSAPLVPPRCHAGTDGAIARNA